MVSGRSSSALKIYLLGPPLIELNGKTVDIQRRKAMALLIYLAVTGQRRRRDSLALLFWPDSAQRRARKSLRRDLSELKQALENGWLDADRESVGLQPGYWLDVADFQGLLADRAASSPPSLACLHDAVAL